MVNELMGNAVSTVTRSAMSGGAAMASAALPLVGIMTRSKFRMMGGTGADLSSMMFAPNRSTANEMINSEYIVLLEELNRVINDMIFDEIL
jgi:hypothetical protein